MLAAGTQLLCRGASPRRPRLSRPERSPPRSARTPRAQPPIPARAQWTRRPIPATHPGRPSGGLTSSGNREAVSRMPARRQASSPAPGTLRAPYRPRQRHRTWRYRNPTRHTTHGLGAATIMPAFRPSAVGERLSATAESTVCGQGAALTLRERAVDIVYAIGSCVYSVQETGCEKGRKSLSLAGF